MLKYEVVLSSGYNVYSCKYFRHGNFHRKNSPAYISNRSHMSWYEYGERHRKDGYALLFDGELRFYIRGKVVLKYEVKYYLNFNGYLKYCRHSQSHRLDGPALVWNDCDMFWDQYDNLHRVDGPAIVCSTGSKEYWKRGIKQC